MDRIHENSFRQDVYSFLKKTSDYRVTGFLTTERKLYDDNTVFFTELLGSYHKIITHASRRGKVIFKKITSFINVFNKVVNDEYAYLTYLHEEELSSLTDSLLAKINQLDQRAVRAFDKYWKRKCTKSIKILYYRFLITDELVPKYEGIGNDASRLLYNKILSFVTELKHYLSKYENSNNPFLVIKNDDSEVKSKDSVIDKKCTTSLININNSQEDKNSEKEKPKELSKNPHCSIILDKNDPKLILFLDYVYNNIVSAEHLTTMYFLSGFQPKFHDKIDYYQQLLNMDAQMARKLFNIGVISANSINRMCEMFRNIFNHPGARNVFDNRDKVNTLGTFIEKSLNDEDVRTYNAYQNFFKSCEGSVLNLYLRIVGMRKYYIKFAGLNLKKSLELYNKLSGLLPSIDAFLSNSIDNVQNEDRNTTETLYDSTDSFLYHNPGLNKFYFSDEELEKITNKTNGIGYFPLFLILHILLSDHYFTQREREVFQYCSNIYQNKAKSLAKVSKLFDITLERIRQIYAKALKRFSNIINDTPWLIYLNGYRYNITNESELKNIASREEVPFNISFITWAICQIDDNYKLIGDANRLFSCSSKSNHTLYAVPKYLYYRFDFNQFLESINCKIKEKRFFEERIELEQYVNHIYGNNNKDFYEIVKECRYILEIGYPDIISNSQIVLPANTRRAVPDIIEEIIRTHNAPMTANEISLVISSDYPDIQQSIDNIRANVRRNSNIIAISRTGTYTLREWADIKDQRGGTIRDLAIEYLNSLDQPVSSLSNICAYIAKYRSKVSENSVRSNLLSDSNNRFSYYYKDNCSYIGLTDQVTDNSFIKHNNTQSFRSFNESVNYLEKFINDNGRFPYPSEEGEEARLSRFYFVSMSRLKKGELSSEEASEIERIKTTYGHLKVKKERTSWNEWLERFVKYITDNNRLPNQSSREYAWYEKNKALFEAGQLDQDQTNAFVYLIKIASRME